MMNTQDGVYLDHAATSPLRREVWDAMGAALGEADFNPASAHAFGRQAQRCLEEARGRLAAAIGGDRRGVALTGGGTQSNNLAILGFSRAHAGERPRLLISAIEHRAVLEPAQRAEAEGTEVIRLPVDDCGTVDLDALDEALGEGDAPALVSVMWANNEVGTIQPIEEVCALAHDHGALFHTDAVQAFGKVEVSVEEIPVDLLTMTAHKLGGPVGIGLLYVRPGVDLEPVTYGGSQERALWPGTQNALAAVGFAEATRLADEELHAAGPRWTQLRDGLAGRLRSAVPDLCIHCEGAPRRMPNLLSVGVPGCDQAAMLVMLDLAGVAVSGGSACSSGSDAGSHVLHAIGATRDDGSYAALRFSFGPETEDSAIDRAADVVVREIERLRARSGEAATT